MGSRQALLTDLGGFDVASVVIRQISMEDMASETLLQAAGLNWHVAGDLTVVIY